MHEAAAARMSLFSLLHTASAARAKVEARLQEIGLTVSRLLALRALADAGESLPLWQLAERLSWVGSSITQLVARLEAGGLVMRAADPDDRRARLAALTPAGRAALRTSNVPRSPGRTLDLR